MDIMTEKRSIFSLRSELGLDQGPFGREANLSQSTISKIEKGLPHSKHVYFRLFYGINRLRTARGWPEIAYEDIDWPPLRA